MKLQQIAEILNAELVGDDSLSISRIATLENATGNEIGFLANKKYRSKLASTQAGAVILSPQDADYFTGNKIIVANPYLAYALLAQAMDTTPEPATNVHPSAIIDLTAKLDKSVSIGANVVVEEGVEIAAGSSIGAGSFIGKGAKIGTNTKIWANVTIYHQVEIGNSCLVHANTVIGADGFGYANEKGQWVKIPQLGTVVIGDNVEIGASTTIDRGAIDDTIIERNVIIDNQVQIAHNVVVKEGTAIAGCSVIAGSTTIGKYCQIGGLSGIAGHIEIADGVVLTGMSMVISGIDKPGVYSSGVPHSENKDWRRNMAQLRQLSAINKRLKAVEKSLPERDE
ncbi:UDP-3-O-(3-hydroxymyristoyl)glucosamine N-acyltransferase [Pseudoalteromonas sp. MMG024]|uniref:UDP-3-O-(3-hydroxymyristoyl)glucosamine N-acyltransferase n=1 Tax=Pseudoalteromonas sp. MMG024 TaxID=2909980 RepID=UPI001F01E9F2|nr:UDP-3-O-(3-hydroxymyristoyl)glucosamine N-acyltransferase [Pseudoalteromonas sp. MMG024]MCF6458227.1 UDP-3-O-(3-hydroxymyristoyl)glucosamine N-acyltransferase [Pseudoalteromonas sp. MMG024]